jgi:hypothetical protein
MLPLAIIAAFFGLVPAASAVPITYSLTATVSGTLGDTSFTGVALTWTAFANTDNYQPTGLVGALPYVAFDSDTIAIDTVGVLTPTLTFGISNAATYSNLAFNELFFIDPTGATGIAFDDSGTCANCNYDLISPFSASEAGLLFTAIATDQGSLHFTADGPIQFTASTEAVPEPGSVGILLSGLSLLAAVGGFRRFRTQTAAR